MSTTLLQSKIATSPSKTRRSITDLLAPIERLAAHSANLVIKRGATFDSGGENYELPRYLFLGPEGGGSPIRIGIFAAIHGDEPEGAYALTSFIQMLEGKPELAAGYCLSFYPVCNPTGFEDNTRHSRNGRDLNREFWKNSNEPEVRLLQSELVSHAFDGIISLHAHEDGDGLYGSARGVTLTKHLIEPALKAAENFLKRDDRPVIEGVSARNGIISANEEGILSAPPKVRPRPFEITLEAPKSSPAYLKEYAVVVALQAILSEYQKLICYAQNI